MYYVTLQQCRVFASFWANQYVPNLKLAFRRGLVLPGIALWGGTLQ